MQIIRIKDDEYHEVTGWAASKFVLEGLAKNKRHLASGINSMSHAITESYGSPTHPRGRSKSKRKTDTVRLQKMPRRSGHTLFIRRQQE